MKAIRGRPALVSRFAIAATLFALACAWAGAQAQTQAPSQIPAPSQAQGIVPVTDPASVKPAWQIEKELTSTPSTPVPSFGAFFIGYEYPTYSGNLSDELADWDSWFHFSFGMDSSMMIRSSFLNGMEGDLALTFNDNGSMMLMNSMAIFGYSINLMPLRLNLGAKLGLSILDVTDDRPGYSTYTGLGYVVGPEASLYLYLGSDTWLWARGRYSYAQYAMLTGSVPSGDDQLSTVSIQAGLAFDL
jgi:hypothetical protein